MRLNGVLYETIQSEVSNKVENNPFSREVVKKLEKGDKLDFYVRSGNVLLRHDTNGTRKLYFSLELLFI